jgi:long-chain acyl-CoA synthetase
MTPPKKTYLLPLEKFYFWEKTTRDHVFLRQPLPGKGYTDLTYGQAGQQIRAIAAALKGKNLPPGSHIGILSKNCAHWVMADLAIWMAGHVSVPLYPNLSETTVREIVKHSDCKLAFIGKLDDVAAYRRGVPDGVACVAFPYHDVSNAERWDDLVARTKPLTESPTRAMGELATIIYTSGTTGEPKGVMHAFSSFAIAGTEVLNTVGLKENDRFFSYLPLAHVAERILVETCALYSGASIAFAESLDTFQSNLQTIQPTIFLSVPRLWQKFQGGILAKLPQRKLSLLLSIPLVSGLIKKKLRHALGLSAARVVVTGSAPTPAALIEWFAKIGIPMQEAYGMTENFAYSHFNLKGAIKVGTVGQPWPMVKTRIGADEEIQISSPCDFLGYYKSGTDRSAYFDGEYFRTGDRGQIDASGHLKITGRTKDLFKTSKGKYIAPSPIEAKFAANAFFEAVCVVGANLPSPLILAMLNPGVKALPKEQIEQDLGACLTAVNHTLDPHERIAKLVLVKDAWTVESGLVTPSMKVKRAAIEGRYGKHLSQWEVASQSIIWET